MRLTRDRLLLAVGVTSGAVGAVLLFLPGLVPGFGPLDGLTDTDAATQVGLVLGVVVAVLAAYQMRRTGRATLDRSDLLPDPPEAAHDATVPAPGVQFARTYRQVRAAIDRFGRTGWHAVAYGRRAVETSRTAGAGETDRSERTQPADRQRPRRPARADGRPPVGTTPRRKDQRGSGAGGRGQTDSDPGRPGNPRGQGRRARAPDRRYRQRTRAELFALLDGIAETARDAYAAANDCDEATAERAVARGTWTDDRVAAAFLATSDDAPTFTVRERARAWLAPQHTLDRRLERTLAAIETHADSYLTYRTPATSAGTDGPPATDPPGDGAGGSLAGLGGDSDSTASATDPDGDSGDTGGGERR